MSVYISRRYGDRVEVIADSAFWSVRSLRVTSFSQKVKQVPCLPLVVAGRGAHYVLMSAFVLLAKFARQEVQSAARCAGLRRYCQNSSQGSQPIPVDNDLLLAGYDEAAGRFFHRVVVVNSPMNGWDKELGVSPGDFVEDSATVAAVPLSRADGIDLSFPKGLRDDGVELLKQARANVQPWNGKPLISVGGKITLATVTRDGVDFERMGGWPDKWLRRIDPAVEFVSTTC